jgi:5-bromo-4-chloroindolyl phosphate hydrolysis protein
MEEMVIERDCVSVIRLTGFLVTDSRTYQMTIEEQKSIFLSDLLSTYFYPQIDNNWKSTKEYQDQAFFPKRKENKNKNKSEGRQG